MFINKKTRSTVNLIFSAFLFSSLLYSPSSHGKALLTNLDEAINDSRWNDAVEISFEIISQEQKKKKGKEYPDNTAYQAMQKGAFALFQKGYSNSALLLLKNIPTEKWKALPQGQDRLAEIIALFQKKVPLNLLPTRLEQLDISSSSEFLKNEIRFAKGRHAFEHGEYNSAFSYLSAITTHSRYYAPARYILGSIAIKQNDYRTAETRFSEVFQTGTLDNSTEFWTDMTSQISSHWGSNVRLLMNTDGLVEIRKVAELSLLALARISYAQGRYEQALERYSRLKNSFFESRARLEKIWTYFAMNKHEEAQTEAATLAVEESSFDAIEARILRAISLTDSSLTQEARFEVKNFSDTFFKTKERIEEFKRSKALALLPAFLNKDFEEDGRLKNLEAYLNNLNTEIKSLEQEDSRLFPVYTYLASDLQPLISETKQLTGKIITDLSEKRLKDLTKLFGEAKLISAETYLEDREKLRATAYERGEDQISDPNKMESSQRDYEEKMTALLDKAVEEVETYRQQGTGSFSKNLALEYRQSEILWELATAYLILKKPEAEAKKLRLKALEISKNLTEHHQSFSKHDQSMFFTGYAQMELGFDAEGEKSLQKFVSVYKDRMHVDDAHRILGDIYFDKNDFQKAEYHFKKILDFPESPIVGYALYKIGWCNYNTKSFAKALLGLEKAVLWALNTKRAETLITLKREAKRDLISVYAEVGNHKRALDYFSQFFRNDDAAQWINELAKQLESMGQFEKTNDLYRSLMALNPDSVDNIRYLTANIDGAYKLHNWDDVLKLAEELNNKYGDEIRKAGPKNATPSMGFAEDILRRVTISQHKEVKDNNTPEALARLEKLDNLYLKVFGPGKFLADESLAVTPEEQGNVWAGTQEPLYLHAHLLFRAKKMKGAVVAFRTHWKLFENNLKEPLKEESLKNYVYALANLTHELTENKELKDTPKEIPEMIAMIDRYEQLYPKSKNRREFAFIAASSYFKSKNSAQMTEEGIKRSQLLFDQAGNDDIGKKSFKNLKVTYYESKNWKAAYEWSTESLEKVNPKEVEYIGQLKAIREESLFLWANETKDDLESANLFLKLANDKSIKNLKDRALFNVFIRYEKAQKPLEALDIGERLEREFPKFENLTDLAGVRASMYQEAGDYEKALPLLNQFIAKDKKAPQDIKQKAEKNRKLIAEALQWKGAPNRSLSSVDSAENKNGLDMLNRLQVQRAAFNNKPMPERGDLAQRIKGGVTTLEELSSKFIELSKDKKVSSFVAFEAFCSLPSLYESMVKSLEQMGNKIPEIKSELANMTGPLSNKATELFHQCIEKGTEAEHSGPEFEKALVRYGWKKNKGQVKVVADLSRALDAQGVWLEKINDENKKFSQSELLEKHILSAGNENTWYALALTRMDEKKLGLSRLTLVDAHHKYPDNGKIMNALGALDKDADLLEKAAKNGAHSAWVNLALIHLKASKLALAKNALLRALDEHIFDSNERIKKMVEEFTKSEENS